MMLTRDMERILSNSQSARDSDNELIVQMLQARGLWATPKQLEVLRDFNFESVRRTRQKFQHDGKYPASPNIARTRRIKSQMVQQQIPNTKPERTEQLITRIPRPWGKG